jgi:hypothetical protein
MSLTILTERKYFFKNNFARILELIIYEILKFFNFYPNYSIGGHYAVTRSIIHGLKQNNVKFNYNPLLIYNYNKTVIILNGISELKKCINLKKNNTITSLHVGPNLVTRSTEFNSIILNSNIDSIIVPSKWVEFFYKEDLIELNKKKFVIWASGVRLETLNKKFKTNSCIIYYKSGDINLAYKIKEYLTKKNFNVFFILYGNYIKQDYIALLKKSKFSVFISESESQGIAMFESWSCNVPTFVWRNQNNINILDKLINYHSTCPYLNSSNGIFFNNFFDFVNIYNKNQIKNCNPRLYIQNYFTDKKSTKYLLNQINYI